MYINLSRKVEDLSTKTLFAYIAADSLKHTTVLNAILDEVGSSKAQQNDWEMNIKYKRGLIKKLSNDIGKSRRIGREELFSLISTLTGFENLLYTEYKKAFHLEYRNFFQYEPIKKDDANLNVLTLIVDDEERHQRILSAIMRISDKDLSTSHDDPTVKYRNPDSWYVPPRRFGQ